MKTANIPPCINIAACGNIALSANEIDYTLKCLGYICTVFVQYLHHSLAALAPLGLLIVKTLTNVLCNYYVEK